MSDHPMQLADADFWDDPPPVRPFLDSRGGSLDEELLLDGPARVDLETRRTVPVAIYRCAEGGKTVAWPLDGFLHVAAVHVESHWSKVARAFTPTVVEAEPYVPGGGLASTLRFFDLRGRLGVPWKQGTLLVTGLIGHQRTNTIKIELGGGPSVFEDAAVAEHLEWLRRQAKAAEVLPAPGTPYPSYGFEPATRPEGVGIVLEAERVVVLEKGARIVVRGAFRLPLLGKERVPAEPDPAALRASLGGRLPVAIVPIKLAVLASRTSDCTTIPLRVPVFDPPEEVDGQTLATGTFALDLLDVEDVPRKGQTLFVYAIADEVLAGPTMIGIITPDMLP